MRHHVRLTVPRHYLDHASTSPLRPTARRAMTEALGQEWGDPGRIHHEGLAARQALEDARSEIAEFFGAVGRSVVFTSGATEAIATAVYGVADGPQVASAVEHSAVRLHAARRGALALVGCDRTATVDPDEVERALESTTAVVHVQWGNHEVGTRQPLWAIVDACRRRGALLHTDAAQAAGRFRFDESGADLATVSAHKMGGPTGIGALLVRRGLRLDPWLVGGEQERARRAGTESVLAAVGWAAACREAAANLDDERRREREQTQQLRDSLAQLDGVEIFGHISEHLGHITCVGIEGIEPQAVLLELDRRSIAVHSGSACASEDLLPSPVLAAMGVDAARSLRVSVGWNTTDTDIAAFESAIGPIIESLRALRR